MRKTILGLLMMMVAITTAGRSRAAEDAVTVETGGPLNQWNVSIDFVTKGYTYQHDALQKLVDYESEYEDTWRNGESEGNGWGLRVTGQKDLGRISLLFVHSEYDYKHTEAFELGVLKGEGTFKVATQRRDFDVWWSEITGTADEAYWGWNLGFRYLGMDKTISYGAGVLSTNDVHVDVWQRGSVTWQMIMAGYFGEMWPFGKQYFNLHGSLNGLFGEVSGLARIKSVETLDPESIHNTSELVEQIYDENKYSIAYGLRGSVGMGFRITKRFSLGIDYEREWLYSFKGTETGLVLFPDNHDALFIENNHNVYAYLGFMW